MTRRSFKAIRHHLANVTDIRQHFASNMAELQWEFSFENSPSGRIPLRHYWIAAKHVLRERFTAVVCEVRGHDIVSEAASAEHGTEELSCKRCGWQHHIQW